MWRARMGGVGTAVVLAAVLSSLTLAQGTPGPCGVGQIAHDIQQTETPYGRVEIEECVTRDGNGDTYYYYVTNVSCGQGLCSFEIPNNTGTATPATITNNAGWQDSATLTSWRWTAPSAGQGIAVGHTAEFRFSLSVQTVDIPLAATVGMCAGGEEFPAATTGPYYCPREDVADLTLTTTPDGDVEIQECVTHSPDGLVDTYSYMVSNISYLADNCGICMFGVPNAYNLYTIPGSMLGPVGWSSGLTFTHAPFGPGWEWRAPVGDCGILPGQWGVFSFSVPAPTFDYVVTGYVEPCKIAVDMGSEVKTTGPGGKQRLCDLTVDDLCVRCTCEEDHCVFIVYATVHNLGPAPTPIGSDVTITATPGIGSAPAVTVPAGFIGAMPISFTVPWTNQPVFWCPNTVHFVVTADAGHVVTEGNESNNSGSVDACCEREEKLPNLVTTCLKAECECVVGETDISYCKVVADVCVCNTGTMGAGPFKVSVSCAFGSGAVAVPWLAATDCVVVQVVFSFPCDPRVCETCPLLLTAMADSGMVITESTEVDNKWDEVVCCGP